MLPNKIDVLVVGAGQAGIAISEHLKAQGIDHLVVEKNRIAQAWRTGRWDSLVANGPAWHDRFPGLTFRGYGADEFVKKDDVADYFEQYVEKYQLPVHCGVEVQHARRLIGQAGFQVDTNVGSIEARYLVIATGPFQRPSLPEISQQISGVEQIHSAQYFNPEQLAEGGVMVVGAGSSGVQIADELNRAGRNVWLSVGAHDRPPRSYRQRDFCWWLGVLGLWDATQHTPGKEHVTIAVSGARGGQTVDFRRLASEGITLTGVTQGYQDGKLHFKDDLQSNIAAGDQSYLNLLDAADEYVRRNGLDLPEEPEARQFIADAPCIQQPLNALDLEHAGIKTIIWATGYKTDYQWLDLPITDAQGKPKQHRGVAEEPGIYFLGLPWQSRRGSSFIWGVWHDAKYIAEQISIQQKYQQYQP